MFEAQYVVSQVLGSVSIICKISYFYQSLYVVIDKKINLCLQYVEIRIYSL